MRTILLAALVAATPAIAGDQPEFMLQDIGVRVDLPAEWTATRWTPKAVDGERKDGTAKLYAWSTVGQLDIQASDLPSWAHTFDGMIDNLKGTEVKLRSSEVKSLGGRPTARVDIGFEDGGRKGVLAGASVALDGRMLHIAVVGLADRASTLDSYVDTVAARLDVKKPAEPRKPGESVTAAGMTTALPAGWFKPTEPEAAVAAEKLAALGIVVNDKCWTAVRPHAGDELDAMVTCPDGFFLGVVDDASFVDAEAVLRTRIFASAPIQPGTPLTASDRLGVLYKPELGAMTVRVAAIPTAAGIARTWMIGPQGRSEVFEADLKALAAGATFDGPHPVGLGDQISYYLAYQPTSPFVIGPGLLVLAAAVAGIRLLARPRSSPVDDIA